MLMVAVLRLAVHMSLQRLHSVVRSDDPKEIDLRTWQVVTRDGTPVGTVAEVIVDVDARRPLYLNVLPHAHPEGSPEECWIRVPYRYTYADASSRSLILNDIAALGLGTTSLGRSE
jgi:sporulation protein YlmC with PRC-barrel domain